MKPSKKILFTGGGTAGHVTPNLAIIKKFQENDWEINYIGSKTGIEKELLAKTAVPYHAIMTGKLRRYFCWQNFLDPLKIFCGIVQAIILCRKLQPDIVFSKGGFVGFPVVFAAWLNRISVIVHESDLTVGLANKLSFPFVQKICITFPETINYIKNKNKVITTGIPIRENFFQGDSKQGRNICGFHANKKIILVFGGSLGADPINKAVRGLLPEILDNFQIAHVCGESKIDPTLNFAGYKQFSYLHDEFPHLLATADLVISRSGANSIYELIALRKPNILLPLAKTSSRGDQILNANYCAQHGFSKVIPHEQLSKAALLETIRLALNDSEAMINAMTKFVAPNSVDIIYNLVIKELKI